MEEVGVVQQLNQVPRVRPSGDRVALVIAALLVGGVIMLATLSLGLHEANLIQRITLLSSGGAAAGAGVITALVMGLKSKKSEEVVAELKKEDLPEVFERDLAGSAHLYLIRSGRFGRYRQFQGKLEDVDGFLKWFQSTLQGMGLDKAEILKVMEKANQGAALPLNEKIYDKTGEIGLSHEVAEPFLPEGEKTQQVYLINVVKRRAEVRAVYRYQLAESNKYVRAEVVFRAENSKPELLIGKQTNTPVSSGTRGKE